MVPTAVLFWGSTAWLAYTYAGYPLLLAVVSRLRPRPWRQEPITPTVSLIIAAWNEEAVIEEKILNALALDYPREHLEIIVASDGSDDRTVAIAQSFEPRGVRVLDLPRAGKTATLNRAVASSRGEILVFSDANVMFEPGAIRRLVRHFADPRIGGVSGDVRLEPRGFTLGKPQGFYYRYERFIQRAESLIGSTVGADGGMYAIRRAHFHPVPDDILNDDFVISMRVVTHGFRLVYDPEAVAHEESPPDARLEFRRKTRVEQGNFQAMFRGEGVPGLAQPWALFTYAGHKVMRWTAFVPLGIALGTSARLAPWGGIPALALGAQTVLYLLALAGWRAEGRCSSVLSVPFYFVLENLAAARGLWRLLRGDWDWGRTRQPGRT